MMDNATIKVDYTNQSGRRQTRFCLPEALDALMHQMLRDGYTAMAYDTAAGNRIVGTVSFDVTDKRRHWSVWIDESVQRVT